MAQIILFAGNLAPRSYMFCHGQLMSIDQNPALFALLGNTYGGDGQYTYALPDFRGRIPVGAGQGPGLSNIYLGEQSGWNSITLTTNQMPQHTHFVVSAAVSVNTAAGNTANPGGAVISGGNSTYYAPAANATGQLSGISATVQPAGSNQPFSNNMPSLGINFVIAVEGIFPSRN